MKPAFHKDATIFGYVGGGLFASPIEQLFVWNDENERLKSTHGSRASTSLTRLPPCG